MLNQQHFDFTSCSLFIAYGAPEEISTDSGPQFTSNEFQNFLHHWGVRHHQSSANYPQSNGRAELGVKAAKQLIIDNTKSDGSLDDKKAAQAIMQYYNTPLPLTSALLRYCFNAYYEIIYLC